MSFHHISQMQHLHILCCIVLENTVPIGGGLEPLFWEEMEGTMSTIGQKHQYLSQNAL